MGVMCGIAFGWPVALAGLPDDMIIRDPSRLDMRTIEKHAKPISACSYDAAAHIVFPTITFATRPKLDPCRNKRERCRWREVAPRR